jgi:hypothetical protein
VHEMQTFIHVVVLLAMVFVASFAAQAAPLLS